MPQARHAVDLLDPELKELFGGDGAPTLNADALPGMRAAMAATGHASAMPNITLTEHRVPSRNGRSIRLVVVSPRAGRVRAAVLHLHAGG